MAYITCFNYARLDGMKNHIQMSENGVELHHKYALNWFSNQEANHLYLHKILLLNQEHVLWNKLIARKWLLIQTPKDNFTHFKAPKAPAYHCREDCSMLASDFENFELPVGFVETYGEAEVERFREWCVTARKDGRTPLQLIRDGETKLFITAVSAMKWEGRSQLLNWKKAVESYLAKQNSGQIEFFNLTLEEVEVHIDRIMQEFGEWQATLSEIQHKALNAHMKQAYLIYKGKEEKKEKLSYPGMLAEELYALLDKFIQEFKNPIKTLFIASYYQTALESGISLDGNVLSQLGFKPCRHCCTQPHSGTDNMPSEEKLKQIQNRGTLRVG